MVDDNNNNLLECNSQRYGDKSFQSNAFLLKNLQNQIGDTTILPPSTDRMRIQDNYPILIDLGIPSPGTHKSNQ